MGGIFYNVVKESVDSVNSDIISQPMWMQKRIEASKYIANNLKELCYENSDESDDLDLMSQVYFLDQTFASYSSNLHDHLWLMLDFKPSYKCWICPCFSKHEYNNTYYPELHPDDNEKCREIKNRDRLI